MNATPSNKITHRFAFKVMGCAFCGIHIPLIGMMVYLFTISGTPSTLKVLFGILVFSLLGTAATLLILNRMLRPLQVGNLALRQFIDSREVHPLPKNTNDELGVLFQQIEYLMFVLQKTVSERDRILELAITSNDDFQQSLKQFTDAKEAAFVQHDPGKMKSALEEVLRTVSGKLDSANRLLRTFGQPISEPV
jgi:hypothetical protein